MMIRSGENSVTLLWATGALSGGGREFEVPLDSTLKQVAFSLSVDTHATTMDVLAPSGAPASASGAGTEVTDLNCGRLVILKNPAPGAYRIRIRGSGRFWLAVEGQSDIFLHAVRFVEPGGRPGHEGMFAIQGFPLAGRETDVEAEMDGEISTLHFEFRSPSGEVLRSFRMKKLPEDEQEYAGKVTIPDTPFLIYAVGVDMHGERFQRMKSGRITPATFRVDAPPFWEIKAGQASTCMVKVTNRGPASLFRLSVRDANNLLREVSPREFQLESDASLEVALTFREITDAKIVGGSLVFTVERADSEQRNFAVMETTVWRE
jgi:hypothetical protein